MKSKLFGENVADNDHSKEYKILELYSGIGGFHFAIKELFESVNYQLIACDINTSANHVYRLNHQDGNENIQILERNIQSLTIDLIDKMNLFLLTMSPPCQPFTRLGNKKDVLDSRCESFLYLIDILPKLENKPQFIMLENVKGFETSEAHNLFLNTLIICKYDFKEFLLSPEQFSIPNSRCRYYLLAKYSPNNPNLNQIKEIIDEITYFKEVLKDEFENSDMFKTKPIVKNYLQELDEEQFEKFSIRDDRLLRYYTILDIVDSDSTTTNCFTKSYGHCLEGCGSILKTSKEHSTDFILKQIKELEDPNDDAAKLELLRKLKLRFFTPREVANLMCFPEELKFPKEYTIKQCYRLLGNSVNVKVCFYLLKSLISSKLKN